MLTARLQLRTIRGGLGALVYGSLGLAWLLLSSSSCGPASARERLLVFAAASTADVVMQLFEEQPGVRTSFGPSSALARQLGDGAPADLFLSASKQWVDEVVRSGRAVDEPVLIAQNAVVCVAATGSPLSQSGVDSPAALVAALDPGDLVAVADEGVPVGEYARESLRAGGHWAAISSQAVGQADARACLRAARTGEVAAAFVYVTDARLGGVDVLFELEPGSDAAVELWAVQTSERSGARELMGALQGARARAVLESAGFHLPGEVQ